MKNLALVVLFLISAIPILSSCGSQYGQGPTSPPYAPGPPNSLNSTTSFTPGSAAASSCSSTPNVTNGLGGQYDNFTVCPSSAQPGNLLIHGTTRVSNTICVFPVEVSNGQAYPLLDPSGSGLPWEQCAQAASGGINLSFSSGNFNAVYIAESPYAAEVQFCLAYNQTGSCSYSSFGQFR